MFFNRNTYGVAFHSAAYNSIGKLLSTLFFFLAFILIAKSLSIGDYGKYNIYLNVVFFVTLILDFGVAEVVLRYVPEYVHKNQIASIRKLLKNSFAIIFLGGLISILLLLLIIAIFPGAPERLHIKTIVFPGIIIFGCLRIIALVLSNVLNSFLFQTYRITSEIFLSGIRLILIYILVRNSCGPWGFIMAFALIDLFSIVLFYLKLHIHLSSPVSEASETGFFKALKFGINEYLFKLFWFFTDNRFDLYLIGIILGMKEVGYFAFAASIANFFVDWSPGFIIRPVIAPLFVKTYTAGRDIPRIQYLFGLHNKFLAFITLPIYIIIGVYIDKIIIYLFDPKYLPSIPVFLILTSSTFFLNALIPLRNIIALIERPDISNLTNIIAIPKILLIFIFARIIGVNGVACIYAISVIAILGINIMLINKSIKLTYPFKGLFKIFINCVIMGIFIYFLKSAIVNKATLILSVFLAIAIYAVLAYLNKAFEDEDREIFNRAFKVKLWHF